MSDVLTDSPMTLSDDEILDFLKSNPDFLKRNPSAYEYLIPPKDRPRKGQPADFQSYVIERLKADKDEVVSSTRQLVENARSNMNNQQRIHTAVLALLEARSFDEFIQRITMDLAAILNVDIAVLVVEADGKDIPHIGTSGIRVIPEGTVDSWMNGHDVMLQDNISGIEAIYGGGATLVQSQILLRIGISMDTPPAMLAFASRDPNMFQEGQATDQILFLTKVIERCFRSWLSLPV